MTSFLRDLWHDLREKRLWPVAAVLLLAVVAAPAVMLESASGGGEPVPVAVPPATAGDQVPVVALADGSQQSDLESFKERDPFAASGPAATKPAEPDGASAPEAGSAPEAPGAGAAPSGDGALGVDPLPGGLPDSGGGGSGGSDGQAPAKKVAYNYVVDVRFGRRDGDARLYPSLQRLDVLPRTASPVLVFLGVSPTGKTAIFLLDSSVQQRGDGRCQPSKDECTFVHLNAERNHDLHFFTLEDGREYAIRLVEIRKERADARARTSRRARASLRAPGARGARARAAARREKARRPVLGADEIVYER